MSSWGSLIHATVGNAGARVPRYEAFGVGDIAGIEHLPTLGSDEVGPAVVDMSGRVEPDARMTVVVVIPTKNQP
jgi:hypothetical protein